MTPDELECLAKLLERKRDQKLPEDPWDAVECVIEALQGMAEASRATEVNHDTE